MLKDRLRSARVRAGMTLDEVAQKVGVSRQTIQRYESGVISNIPSDNIEKLAQALNTTPAVLMGWDTGNVSAKYRMDFDGNSQMHALTQAFWRRPAMVQTEIIRRLEALDTTFAQNVSKLLKASGDINGFMKETGLDFDAVGKFMQGEPVQTTPEEAEKIAAFFKTDIVGMFFDDTVLSYQEPDSPHKTTNNSFHMRLIEKLFKETYEAIPKDSCSYEFLAALENQIKHNEQPLYEKTKRAIQQIESKGFGKWLSGFLSTLKQKDERRYDREVALNVLADQLYKNVTMFEILFRKSKRPVENFMEIMFENQ